MLSYDFSKLSRVDFESLSVLLIERNLRLSFYRHGNNTSESTFTDEQQNVILHVFHRPGINSDLVAEYLREKIIKPGGPPHTELLLATSVMFNEVDRQSLQFYLNSPGMRLIDIYDSARLNKLLAVHPDIEFRFFPSSQPVTTLSLQQEIEYEEIEQAEKIAAGKLQHYHSTIIQGSIEQALKWYNPDFETIAYKYLIDSTQWSVITSNKKLSWYTDQRNIPNQRLVADTVNFVESFRPSIDTTWMLNFIDREIMLLQGCMRHVKVYLTHLHSLPIDDVTLHLLTGLILFWHGGYPVDNMNDDYEDLLQQVEAIFLSRFRGVETPEKKFFAKSFTDREKMKMLEDYLNNKSTPSKVSPDAFSISLPKHNLDASTLLWLRLVYDKFLRNEDFNVAALHTQYSDKLEWPFEPEHVHQEFLQSGKHITLLGIYQVNDNAIIFQQFDRVVLAVKQMLARGQYVESVSASKIFEELPDISQRILQQIVNLMERFGGFLTGTTKTNDDIVSLSVNRNDVYKRYREYKGLQQFMNEYLSIGTNTPSQSTSTPQSAEVVGQFGKTPYAIRGNFDLNPVMGVKTVAADLSTLIDSMPADSGQMIGIFGKWGRGKSYLLREMWNVLEKNKKIAYQQVTYQAWKYQETPASWAYLYELFVNEYLGKFSWRTSLTYLKNLVNLNYERLSTWNKATTIAILLLIPLSFVVVFILLNNAWLLLTVVIAVLAIDFSALNALQKKLAPRAKDLIRKYTIRHSFRELLGLQAEIQKELITLLKVWISEKKTKIQKIVLFVEDLDRCTEERIMQNIDALRLLLDDTEISKRLIIVNAIDERILLKAVSNKYKDLYKEELQKGLLGREYLDKLFILAIKLGTLTIEQKEEYVSELIRLERSTQNDAESKVEMQSVEEPFRTIANELPFSQHPEAALQPIDVHPESVTGSDYVQSDAKDEKVPKEIKMNEEEITCFNKIVQDWEDPTPRQIKIFYYRYLLIKNLLIDTYELKKTTNPWRDNSSVIEIMKIIHNYSTSVDSNFFSQQKSKLLSEEFDKGHADWTVGDTSVRKTREDIAIIFDVLELAVAY